MASKIFSAGIIGLDAQIIEIETDVNRGLRCFVLIGLPDKTIEESKERVGSAIQASGLKPPHSQPQRVLVNLAPADLKKEGSLYDLPIALGYLSASDQIPEISRNKMFVGELSLDGKLRPIKGALAFALKAKENNFKSLVVPAENAVEAALVKDIEIFGASNLEEVVGYLSRGFAIPKAIGAIEEIKDGNENGLFDIGLIKGQESAKRALAIAVAGGHNLLMVGPPGAGKTLLAKSIVSISPELTFEESLEVTRIYSAAGFLPQGISLLKNPPFRAPHHTSSEASLIGGGNPPRPGEITLAHRGVLFLDEFPEFHRDVLESLRQPMEEGRIMVSRAKYSYYFPAKFSLICSANPCPCGFLNNPDNVCSCSASQIQKYQRKLSGPLVDRIDIRLEVPKVEYEKLVGEETGDSASEIKRAVGEARNRQRARLVNDRILLNSEMGVREIKKHCSVPETGRNMLKKYVDSGKLSARGFHRVLKVARTIADLENSKEILFEHIGEAISYRV